MWTNSHEVREAMFETRERLLSKRGDAKTALVEVRVFEAFIHSIAVDLEHARLTGRLVAGSAALPGMGYSTETKSIPAPRRKALRRR